MDRTPRRRVRAVSVGPVAHDQGMHVSHALSQSPYRRQSGALALVRKQARGVENHLGVLRDAQLLACHARMGGGTKLPQRDRVGDVHDRLGPNALGSEQRHLPARDDHAGVRERVKKANVKGDQPLSRIPRGARLHFPAGCVLGDQCGPARQHRGEAAPQCGIEGTAVHDLSSPSDASERRNAGDLAGARDGFERVDPYAELFERRRVDANARERGNRYVMTALNQASGEMDELGLGAGPPEDVRDEEHAEALTTPAHGTSISSRGSSRRPTEQGRVVPSVACSSITCSDALAADDERLPA